MVAWGDKTAPRGSTSERQSPGAQVMMCTRAIMHLLEEQQKQQQQQLLFGNLIQATPLSSRAGNKRNQSLAKEECGSAGLSSDTISF